MKHRAQHKALTARQSAWKKQADWHFKFLQRLKETPSVHGMKWTLNMMKFYVKALNGYLANPPQGCKKLARPMRTKLEWIEVWMLRELETLNSAE